MPLIKPLGRDIPEKTEYILGFLKGLNTLQDESLIDDHELSRAINSILVVDGIQKRMGNLNYGSSSQSRVYAASAFYTSATSNNRFLIREAGTSLAYYDAGANVTNIASSTVTTATRAEFAMARDTLYYVNPTDFLAKITIVAGVPTFTKFTALTTPVNLVVTATGVTGSTHYSYRVSAYNATGETLACTSVAITNGNATLSSSNYNALTWDAVASAVGYVVYGRKASADNGIGETKMSYVTTNSYNDQGQDTPSTVFTPPEGNSTGGQKGSMIIYAMSRLFIAGDTANPSRLYYSGSGTQIDDFSTAIAGGWVDVSKNDGQKITAIKYFQNYVMIFKDKSIWRFSFTTAGLPQLELITTEIGCCSFRTVQIVNNALWFGAIVDGRFTVNSLDQVAGYVSGALRTTKQSIKISSGSLLDSVNVASAQYACAIYFRDQYIVCIPHSDSTINNRCYVFDTRFNCWVSYWTNINANCFVVYNNGTTEDLYYASEDTGYLIKMFTGTDDNGTAISWQIQTKAFNQRYFDQYKIYRNPIFWFKNVTSGNITGYLINDGVFSSGQFAVSSEVSGISWDYDLFDTSMFDDSLGAATTSTVSDRPTEIIFNKVARSIKFELDEATTGGSFKFLGLSYRWTLLEGKPLPPDNRIRITA